MLTFEDNHPRSDTFVNPYYIKEPEFHSAYRKMASKCTFPAAFANGLYHEWIGIFICVIGLFYLLTLTTSMSGLVALIAGAVLGAILSTLYCRYLQTRALFPRGACMVGDLKRPPVLYWILPVIFFIALPIYLFATASPIASIITIGCVCGLIQTVSFIATARVGLLYTSLLMLIIPIGMAYMGLVPFDNILMQVIASMPYEGIVFVLVGVFLTQRASMPTPQRHDREMLRSYLKSDNKTKRFTAASFICNSLDIELIPELLECCYDDNKTVATTAQIAFGNTWGPRPKELFKLKKVEKRTDVPQEYQEQIDEQNKKRRDYVLDRWKKHNELIEEMLRTLPEKNETAMENLFKLANGEGVHHFGARTVAIEMLGSLKTPRAYATLMDILQHKDKRAARAAEAGFYGADSKAVIYLEKFFTAQSSWLRKRAIRATRCLLDYLLLFDKEDADVAYALLEPDIDGLFDTYDTPTFAATISLLRAETPEEIETLEEYCLNDRPLIRAEAIWALTKLQPERAENMVVPLLTDSSAAIRCTAILCIEKLRLMDAMRYFERASHDFNPIVARTARRAGERVQELNRPINPWTGM